MIRKGVFATGAICFMSALLIGFFANLPVYAQEREATTEQKTVKVKKSVRAPARMAVDSAAKLRADIKQCGMPCSMGGSGSIAAPGGTTRDYDCDENGNCHCFGAMDCVAMSKICAEGTMGCNDQGCICEQG